MTITNTHTDTQQQQHYNNSVYYLVAGVAHTVYSLSIYENAISYCLSNNTENTGLCCSFAYKYYIYESTTFTKHMNFHRVAVLLPPAFVSFIQMRWRSLSRDLIPTEYFNLYIIDAIPVATVCK